MTTPLFLLRCKQLGLSMTELDLLTIGLINDMTDQCIKYTASELVEITHHQSPWIDNYALNCHNKISNDEIKNYFKEIQ